MPFAWYLFCHPGLLTLPYLLSISGPQEAGKPLKDAKAELGRAYDTFTIGAEEAIRQYGEYLPLDVSSRNVGFTGIVRRFPVGLISMITPFNFPYDRPAHGHCRLFLPLCFCTASIL